MSPRPPRHLPDHQRPLDLPTPPPAKPRTRVASPDPEQLAKVAVARRTKPSMQPDHVKLALKLDIPRAPAERLSARAIREQKNLEGVVIELLERGSILAAEGK